MEFDVSGNELPIIDTPEEIIEETPNEETETMEEIENDNTENMEDIKEPVLDNSEVNEESTENLLDSVPSGETWQDFPDYETLTGETVSGSDVRTDIENGYDDATAYVIDYTDILEIIDEHLEEIETNQTSSFLTKPLNDYTTSEGLLLLIFILFMFACLWSLLNGK